MGGDPKNAEICPRLLDLIPEGKEWLGKRPGEPSSEENKLELRLGPPSDQDWSRVEAAKNTIRRDRDKSLLCLGHFINENKQANQQLGAANWFSQQHQPANAPPLLRFPSGKTTADTSRTLPVTANELSPPCSTNAVADMLQNAEKKALSAAAPSNTTVPNISQKRTAPGPVVGWPPVRSFRKNLASSSHTKPALDSQSPNPNKKVANEKQVESCDKGLFVKINMDGVPIGRKVDLKAYDSYDKLSAAVDELFRGLLAAQRDSSAGGTVNEKEEKAITGVLDGSGEYTLVYEDNEGDRMLVGDVPWHMFVSTVKRLRVLKSSEVSALNLTGNGSKTRQQ